MSLIRCPTCGKRFEAAAGHPYSPFCSERCQLIDLGAWLNGNRRIPGGPDSDPPASGDAEPPRTTTH